MQKRFTLEQHFWSARCNYWTRSCMSSFPKTGLPPERMQSNFRHNSPEVKDGAGGVKPVQGTRAKLVWEILLTWTGPRCPMLPPHQPAWTKAGGFSPEAQRPEPSAKRVWSRHGSVHNTGPDCPHIFSLSFLTEQGIVAPLAFHWSSDHGFLLSSLLATAYPCHMAGLSCELRLGQAAEEAAPHSCKQSHPESFEIKKPKPTRFKDDCSTFLHRKDMFCA